MRELGESERVEFALALCVTDGDLVVKVLQEGPQLHVAIGSLSGRLAQSPPPIQLAAAVAGLSCVARMIAESDDDISHMQRYICDLFILCPATAKAVCRILMQHGPQELCD